MTTETLADEALTDDGQHQLRNSQVTYANGRRERLQATAVLFPTSSGMVHFHAPDARNGWGGRLVLTVVLRDIAEIRDLDADIAQVTVTRSFWQRFLDAFTFSNTAKRGES